MHRHPALVSYNVVSPKGATTQYQNSPQLKFGSTKRLRANLSKDNLRSLVIKEEEVVIFGLPNKP